MTALGALALGDSMLDLGAWGGRTTSRRSCDIERESNAFAGHRSHAQNTS